MKALRGEFVFRLLILAFIPCTAGASFIGYDDTPARSAGYLSARGGQPCNSVEDCLEAASTARVAIGGTIGEWSAVPPHSSHLPESLYRQDSPHRISILTENMTGAETSEGSMPEFLLFMGATLMFVGQGVKQIKKIEPAEAHTHTHTPLPLSPFTGPPLQVK